MKKGFTLLELLVVLVIISLVAAFVGPRILSPNNNIRLKTTASKVSSAMRYASNVATTEKKDIIVVFDLKNKRLCMMPVQDFQEKDALLTNTKKNEGLNEFSFPEEIMFMENLSTIEQIDSDTFIIYFFPNGTSSGGNIVLGNDRGPQYKIKVDFVTSIINIDRI
ncbi:MAG: prepilin-type N-terminal cleavage/methylation domain-containing protein [Desulfobacteraceae bacterium]|jgi:type II secretion system protein H|nr:prepilin-type N-terminal cleavage/methylation domain-containing protein [Desulfobacteraceae bacterium]